MDYITNMIQQAPIQQASIQQPGIRQAKIQQASHFIGSVAAFMIDRADDLAGNLPLDKLAVDKLADGAGNFYGYVRGQSAGSKFVGLVTLIQVARSEVALKNKIRSGERRLAALLLT